MRNSFSIAIWMIGGLASTADCALVQKTYNVDGVVRRALVYAPTSARRNSTPLLFAFHGHGGNSRHAAETFNMQGVWPEAITVYMQGLPTQGKFDPEGAKAGWQKSVGEQGDRDLRFFDTVLKDLEKDYKVDQKRIYAMGHSNGGGFTYLLWAARGDVLAAVAPSAAGPAQNFRDLKPLPALHIAGRSDQRVPFETQQRVMEGVRRLNGCDADGKTWGRAGGIVATEYASKSGTPFVAAIYPGTHKFPDEAPELIAKFFKEHHKP